MKLIVNSVVFLVATMLRTGAAQRSAARIEFCKETLVAADRDGDGFINYPEYHLHILKQVSPYDSCPPVNLFGVQLDESYVEFHAKECELCSEFDNDPQCCNSNPLLSKWKVPGTLYPDEYTNTLCNDILDMIDGSCDDRPDEQLLRVAVPTGEVEKLRYYLMALIPLFLLCFILCCVACCGACRHSDQDQEKEEGKSLDTKKSSSIDRDDMTEDPTETDFDLEMNSPYSTRSRAGNFAGLMSVVETEYEDDYMNEFQPRAAAASPQSLSMVEENEDACSDSSDDESSESSSSSSESEESSSYSDEDETANLKEFVDGKKGSARKST